jgi:hypothetical protein
MVALEEKMQNVWQESDDSSEYVEYVLLYDHNLRAFIAYDGDEADFPLHPDEWLGKPIDEVCSRETALMFSLKAYEAHEIGQIVEYESVLIARCCELAPMARHFKCRLIPDGDGFTLAHVVVIQDITIN